MRWAGSSIYQPFLSVMGIRSCGRGADHARGSRNCHIWTGRRGRCGCSFSAVSSTLLPNSMLYHTLASGKGVSKVWTSAGHPKLGCLPRGTHKGRNLSVWAIKAVRDLQPVVFSSWFRAGYATPTGVTTQCTSGGRSDRPGN